MSRMRRRACWPVATLAAIAAVVSPPEAGAALPAGTTLIDVTSGGRAATQLEPIATPAGTGAILVYDGPRGLRATLLTPGAGWSAPEPAGRYDNDYRLLTSRTGTTAAIVERDLDGLPRIRVRDAGGRFAALPVPLEKHVDPRHVGMGGDGSLYLAFPETVEVETGVPEVSRVAIRKLRVLVRAPGAAGWTTIDDAARIYERARALYDAGDRDGALAFIGPRVEPFLVLRADAQRVLVLWRRGDVLEGALGTPAGFEAPFTVAGDTGRIGRLHDVAASDGRLALLADESTGGTDGDGGRARGGARRAVSIWEGPLAGPLVATPLPPSNNVGINDRAVVMLLSRDRRRMVVRTRGPGAPPGPVSVPLPATTTVGGGFFVDDESWDAGPTSVAVAVSAFAGSLRFPHLYAASRTGARGPVWLQGADAETHVSDAQPLVRLLDDDVPVLAWAAEQAISRIRSRSVLYAAYDPRQLAPPARLLGFRITLGRRLCGRGQVRCARRVTFVLRASGDALATIVGRVFSERLVLRAGRTTRVTRTVPPGRATFTVAMPGLRTAQTRTVVIR